MLVVALLFGFLLTSSMPSWASGGVVGNITGTVIAEDTKAPIADASVTATSPAGDYRTIADVHGHFVLIGLPADTCARPASRYHDLRAVVADINVTADTRNSTYQV